MSFDVAVSSSEAGCGCEGCACAPGTARTQPISIDRRDFVMRAAAALAAVALAACSGDSLTSPSSVASTTINLSDHPELSTVGGVATVSVDGVPLAIVRTGSTHPTPSRPTPSLAFRVGIALQNVEFSQAAAGVEAGGWQRFRKGQCLLLA